jgi:NAD(P)-dependent dehydrogenase (short-subunit alcohol dehydrogenase family)
MSGTQSPKIAFITGGGRGIGFETARQLGRLGILPVLGVRDEAKGAAAVAALHAEGILGHSIAADITSNEGRQAVHDRLAKDFGRLDILINNAGVLLDGDGGNTTLSVTSEDLRESFEVNFYVPVFLTRLLLPLLRKAEAGRIVNVSSQLGSLTLHSDPSSHIYETKAFAYDASKTALNALTVHLAHALRGTSIKVNSVHPGWVRTAMGGEGADLDLSAGASTSVRLATLPDDGPTGGFFHMDQRLPW